MAVILDYLTEVFGFITKELQEIIEYPEDFFYLHELQEIEEQYCFAGIILNILKN
jgi:hypothetical protein